MAIFCAKQTPEEHHAPVAMATPFPLKKGDKEPEHFELKLPGAMPHIGHVHESAHAMSLGESLHNFIQKSK
jgi:hypothetical protein